MGLFLHFSQCINKKFLFSRKDKVKAEYKKKGRLNNRPFLYQPKPKLNQKPNHLCVM
jgi:hypothetical protein